MSKYRCLSGLSPQVKKFFLKLPQEIYVLDDSPQDIKTEKAILNGSHVLSKNFSVYPFVVLNEHHEVCCRCLLTYYTNDPIAYLGFFEAKPNKSAVRQLFLHVEQKARRDGKTQIIGPINSSIYIGYRFKTNRFHETYTGEPYNKPYYKEMWLNAGFQVNAKYLSHNLRKVSTSDIDPQMEKIHCRYVERGFEFISPTDDSFKKCMRDVYHVMMESYSGFVGFKKITEYQFLELFSGLKKITNYDMIKLAYKDGKLHAFAIALPNYGKFTKGKLTLLKLLKIMRIKRQPQEYVILYVGADKTVGLGCAIMHHLRNLLYENQCTSITALIKEGNLTGKVYSDLHTDTFEYELFQKVL